MKGFFFSAATLDMARAVPELVPPISMSSPCVSNHSRALVAATSGLFWWSADNTSIFLPLMAPPMSAMAILMASTPPWPSRSAYTLDMSVMIPMRITSPEICACAGETAASVPKARAHAAMDLLSFTLMFSFYRKLNGLDAEVFLQHRRAAGEFGLGELLDDAAVLHYVEAVGQWCGKAEVLLDQYDGVALGLECADHLGELLHDNGCQPFRYLVEQEQASAGAQDPRYG